MKTTQRLHILNPEDIASLYERPDFSDTERRHYFNLPDDLLNKLNIQKNNGRRVAGIVYFILQYGYFKAKHQFFRVTFSEASKDVSFIMRHFLPTDQCQTQLPSPELQAKTKKKILLFTGFQHDNRRTKHKLGCLRQQLVAFNLINS